MNVGTRSILFGAHCFFIHPWFVATAWWKLFGFPRDPRLWVAFFVHDLGYLGKPNMDGPEGETHVELGAAIMSLLFDGNSQPRWCGVENCGCIPDLFICQRCVMAGEKWGNFSRYHSRFYAKRDGVPISKLCIADKLAICLTPAWLYLPMARATGEIREYMKLAEAMNAGASGGKYATMNLSTKDQRAWYADVQDYLRRRVEEHKDGRDDTWTPATRS